MSLTPFVDNRTVTLADAVGKHLSGVRKGLPAHLDIASGFFDLPGFRSLAALLQEGDSVQLLLRAEPPREADLPPPRPGDPTGPERFAHWAIARQAIHADWQHDTDPYNLQPKVPKFLQEVMAFLRKYPPADTTPEELAGVIATISGRIPRRIDIRLREVYAGEHSGNKAKAAAVAKAIRESGLQPAPPRGRCRSARTRFT